ncbi:histidine kinase [Streptomyces sp. NPDC003077]|uniref:sensor histidine kinase n=1 Tax=Streptomyces sp. NPDC003077 TaxID=3154443 RepID=UPI0033B31578
MSSREPRERSAFAKDPRSRPRPGNAKLLDLFYAALSALAALAWGVAASESGQITGDALFWLMLLGVVGSALLWWRRRHPVRVALVLACCFAVTDFALVAALFAVAGVATYRPRRVAFAVTALFAVMRVPFALWGPGDGTSPLVAIAVDVAVLALTTWYGRVMGSRLDLVIALREQARAAEAAALERTELLRAKERERIAREMHDVLAHQISLVSLQAGALKIRKDLPPEEVARAAETIYHSSHQAMEGLREILGVLRMGTVGNSLQPQPTLADLCSLFEECRAAGMSIEVANRLPDLSTASPVGRTAYRVVQEGLTNARKHAPGTTVHVLLERSGDGPSATSGNELVERPGDGLPERSGDELHILVRNPLVLGRDGPLVPGSQFGMIGLAERLEVAGGRLEHGVRRDAAGQLAFHLEAWIPWPK